MADREIQAVVSPPAPAGVYDRIPVENLLFDAKNPRLAEFGLSEDATQSQILQTLWKNMAIQEIAMSIAHSGYFNHEPLFVERGPGNKFVVIEGNPRITNAWRSSSRRESIDKNGLCRTTTRGRYANCTQNASELSTELATAQGPLVRGRRSCFSAIRWRCLN